MLPDFSTRALWVLEALPPGHQRTVASGLRKLFRAKLQEYVSLAVQPSAEEAGLATALVVPGAPFGLAIAWWAGRMAGIESTAPDLALMRVGSALIAHAGGVSGAHAVLSAAAAAGARSRDAAFTEGAIRAQRLARL